MYLKVGVALCQLPGKASHEHLVLHPRRVLAYGTLQVRSATVWGWNSTILLWSSGVKKDGTANCFLHDEINVSASGVWGNGTSSSSSGSSSGAFSYITNSPCQLRLARLATAPWFTMYRYSQYILANSKNNLTPSQHSPSILQC
jgi:hypothetical protein